MKVERSDLHGSNLDEALQKTAKNIDWLLRQGVDVLIIDHGRGLHSDGFAVLKSSVRAYLKEDKSLRQAGYRVVYGESDAPVALGCNDGHVLVVRRGLEQELVGGKRQQEKNLLLHSPQGKQIRKEQKRRNAQRRG